MTARVPIRRLLGLPLAALAAVLLLACTSSGDGGSGLTGDYLEAGGLYETRTPSGALPWVQMLQSVDQRTVFCLEVNVYRVSDLYSVAFTLAYDSSQAGFRGYTVGPFLGDDLLVSVDSSTEGEVIAGLTRQFSAHGMTGVSTSLGAPGTLIELCFDVVGEGSERPMDFIPNLALLDGNGVSVGAPDWVGGLLTTRQ